MGAWDFLYSATDSIKRNSPDITTVKGWCSSSYSYSVAAASKVDQAVRVTGVQKVKEYVSDEESRSRLNKFASNFIWNSTHFAVQEAAKSIPGGGPIYNIMCKSLRDDKKAGTPKKEIEALHAKIALLEKEATNCVSGNLQDEIKALHVKIGHLENEVTRLSTKEIVSDCRKSFVQAGTPKLEVDCQHTHLPMVDADGNLAQKPEDVLRTFIMAEFWGSHYLGDLKSILMDLISSSYGGSEISEELAANETEMKLEKMSEGKIKVKAAKGDNISVRAESKNKPTNAVINLLVDSLLL